MSGQHKPLSDAHLKLFLAILIRNDQVFESFRTSLTVNHFDFVGYQVLYKVVYDYFQEYQQLPDLAQINADVASCVEQNYVALTVEEYDELDYFLEYAFDTGLFKEPAGPKSNKAETFAFKVAQQLLLERQKNEAIGNLRSLNDVTELPKIFAQATAQVESLTSLAITGGRNLTLDTGWDKSQDAYCESCGIGFLDTFLEGGTRAGEAYGILAPFGSYKTTLAVMLWYAAAKQAYSKFLSGESKGKKGLAVIVSYEAALRDELTHRLIMYSAQISRHRLQSMGSNGVSVLSNDADNPLEYEKRIFKEQIVSGIFEPERTRIERVLPIINEHTLCLDFTGSHPKFKTSGNRGVPEIVSAVRAELKRCGPEYYISTVIVDYIGLMVQRDVTVDPKERGREDRLYQLAGMDLVNKIARPFQTPVWAMHQLSGEANAILNPTKRMDHTQAKGSKSFGENLAFCFTGGRLNDDYMGQLACTKHRRAGNHPPVLLRVDGMFNTVIAPEGYTVDRLGKIVKKESIGDTSIGLLPNVNSQTSYGNETETETENEAGTYDNTAGTINE